MLLHRNNEFISFTSTKNIFTNLFMSFYMERWPKTSDRKKEHYYGNCYFCIHSRRYESYDGGGFLFILFQHDTRESAPISVWNTFYMVICGVSFFFSLVYGRTKTRLNLLFNLRCRSFFILFCSIFWTRWGDCGLWRRKWDHITDMQYTIKLVYGHYNDYSQKLSSTAWSRTHSAM